MDRAHEAPSPSSFDIDHFIRKTYRVSVLIQPRIHPISTFVQSDEKRELPIPQAGMEIHYYFLTFFMQLRFMTRRQHKSICLNQSVSI